VIIKYIPRHGEAQTIDCTPGVFKHFVLPQWQLDAEMQTYCGDALGRIVMLDVTEEEKQYLIDEGIMPSGREPIYADGVDGAEARADATKREHLKNIVVDTLRKNKRA